MQSDHPAIEVLKKFFLAMFEWEEETDRYLRSNEVQEMPLDLYKEACKRRREILESIYNEFCESGLSAKRLKDAGLSHGTPREYNPNCDFIDKIEIKPSKIIVETHRTDFGKRLDMMYRYELVLKDGEWRIKDNRKFKIGANDKWTAHLL